MRLRYLIEQLQRHAAVMGDPHVALDTRDGILPDLIEVQIVKDRDQTEEDIVVLVPEAE